MSLAGYGEYKDSGVPWLGDVPAHWNVKPMYAIASINDDVLPESTYADEEIEYVDIGSVSLALGIERTESMRFGASPSRARRIVRDGDVLVSTVRTYLKAIAPVVSPPPNLIASTGFAVVRPKMDSCPGFLKYALQCEPFVQQVIARSTGVSYPAINASDLAHIALWAPPTDDQRKIGIFLDRETAKIDALIAEQGTLLTLLAEKRQATISHAVTRGFDPDVPMKESGIAWLGKVPAHWAKTKLLDLAEGTQHSFVNGPFGSDLLTGELVSDGVPVIYIRDIKEDGYRRVSEWCVTNEKAGQLRFCNVMPGDVIVAKVGDPPGMAAVYPAEERPGIVTQDVIRLRPNTNKAAPEYVCWLLNSRYGQTMVDDISVESTRTRVGLGEYKQLRFFVPPLNEQSAIAASLSRTITRLGALKNQARKAIVLLNERRSALIAAAVTGKIDVRGQVKAEAA